MEISSIKTIFEKTTFGSGGNGELMDSWQSLEISFYKKSRLEPHLLEQVSKSLSTRDGEIFDDTEEGDRTDIKTEIALSLARLISKDKLRVLNTHVELLKQHFSEGEIIHLCAFIYFTNASRELGNMMKFFWKERDAGKENIQTQLDGYVLSPGRTDGSPYSPSVSFKVTPGVRMNPEKFGKLSAHLKEIIILKEGDLIDSKMYDGRTFALYSLYSFFVEVVFEMVEQRISDIKILNAEEKNVKWNRESNAQGCDQ